MTADDLVAQAKSVPHLIELAQTADPALAKQLTEQSLLASKTVWGTALSIIVSALVTKYGLGWDADTCTIVSGAVVFITSALLRMLPHGPITGLIRKANP